VSDIDTAVADSLKVLDLKRPIRDADVELQAKPAESVEDDACRASASGAAATKCRRWCIVARAKFPLEDSMQPTLTLTDAPEPHMRQAIGAR
jgi:hypothetical protein